MNLKMISATKVINQRNKKEWNADDKSNTTS
jgi:hypothetical protein